MAQDPDIRLLTSPRIFLVGMAAFLALVGFVVLILYQQIAIAFSANPGLNGLILGVLAIGALFTFRQVIRLFREIHWVNSLTGAVTDGAPPAPILLAPMAVMLNAGAMPQEMFIEQVRRFAREVLPALQAHVVTRVPVLIGAGIPLFGALAHDVPLRHVATRHYPSGLVQSEYRIDPQ